MRSTIEPFAVRPTEAARIENCSRTVIHQRIGAGEYESYLDGKRRLITLRSIRARQERLLAETAGLKRRAGPGRPKKTSTEATTTST
jgi:hypothetical protein